MYVVKKLYRRHIKDVIRTLYRCCIINFAQTSCKRRSLDLWFEIRRLFEISELTSKQRCASDRCIAFKSTSVFQQKTRRRSNIVCSLGKHARNLRTILNCLQILRYSFAVNIDECHSQPCVHGNCTDMIGYFLCDCEDEYTGKLCDRTK